MRPSGIIIEGQFGKEAISEIIRDDFEEIDVYLPGIAEKQPRKAFYLKTFVEIPEYALSKIAGDEWNTIEKSYLVKDLKVGIAWLGVNLEYPIKDNKVKVTLVYPHMRGTKQYKDLYSYFPFTDHKEQFEGDEPLLLINTHAAYQHLKATNVPENKLITFKIKYVPKKR